MKQDGNSKLRELLRALTILVPLTTWATMPSSPIESVDSLSAAKLTCEKLEVQTPNMLGQTVDHENRVLCHDDSFQIVMSKDCEKNCGLKTAAAQFDGVMDYKGHGTPGSLLCQKVKGSSAIFILKSKAESHKVLLCQKDLDLMSSQALLMVSPVKKAKK